MSRRHPLTIYRGIARCRLAMSLVAIVAIFVDPTEPMLSHWLPMVFGTFVIDPYALVFLLGHLLYSSAILWLLRATRVGPQRLARATTWLDVLFAVAIAAFTEGVASPFYLFFVFAVLAAGLTSGMRRTIVATTISVGLYLALIGVSSDDDAALYIMRPIYLGISGYLVGYLGQQRLNLEAQIRELTAAHQRQQVARDLHDGRAQALAGINLQLESCKELLRHERPDDALAGLSELQRAVNREYDELRSYMRDLAGVGQGAGGAPRFSPVTRFSLRLNVGGTAPQIDRVLQVVREGIANVGRHAQARTAVIEAQGDARRCRIVMDDDGVGFDGEVPEPWVISSLVSELGGTLVVSQKEGSGAHLEITLPS
jgi:signal transduction histidine kinase